MRTNTRTATGAVSARWRGSEDDGDGVGSCLFLALGFVIVLLLLVVLAPASMHRSRWAGLRGSRIIYMPRSDSLWWWQRPQCSPNVSVVVTSLLTPARKAWVNHTSAHFANVTVLRAVNGYSQNETKAALKRSGLRFHRLCSGFGTWGTLACGITRFLALERQVRLRLPFQVLVEDDVQLLPSFTSKVAAIACAHFYGACEGRCGEQFRHHVCTDGAVQNGSRGGKVTCFDTPPDVVQLARFGEGYLTSLEGARRLVRQPATGVAGVGAPRSVLASDSRPKGIALGQQSCEPVGGWRVDVRSAAVPHLCLQIPAAGLRRMS